MTHPQLPNAPRRVVQTAAYWSVLAVCAFLFAYMAQGVAADELRAFDARWLHRLGALHGSHLDGFFLVFTQLGSGLFILAFTVAAVLVAWPRRRSEALFIAFATLGAGLLNHITKLAFARPRPAEPFTPITQSGGYAFPSGHSMVTAAFLVALALTLHHFRPRYRWGVWPAALAVVALMGLSRAYLQVHYPSDVLAGWAFGVAWTLGLNVIFVRYRREAGVAPRDGVSGRDTHP